eukprot:2716102-Lingulodinium_polyedra.AAC.1
MDYNDSEHQISIANLLVNCSRLILAAPMEAGEQAGDKLPAGSRSLLRRRLQLAEDGQWEALVDELLRNEEWRQQRNKDKSPPEHETDDKQFAK